MEGWERSSASAHPPTPAVESADSAKFARRRVVAGLALDPIDPRGREGSRGELARLFPLILSIFGSLLLSQIGNVQLASLSLKRKDEAQEE